VVLTSSEISSKWRDSTILVNFHSLTNVLVLYLRLSWVQYISQSRLSWLEVNSGALTN